MIADTTTNDNEQDPNERLASLEREKAVAERTVEELRTQLDQLRDAFTNPDTLSRLVAGRTAPPEEEPLDPREFITEDGLDVKRLYKKVRDGVQAELKRELEKRRPDTDHVAQQVQQLQATLHAMQQVAHAKAKFPDFDKHENTMIQLSRQLPGATAEQLYYLAKAPDALKTVAALEAAQKKETAEGASTAMGSPSSIESEQLVDSEGKPLTGNALTRALAERLYP